jgi:TlyA family rRNA methyltransferase/putative hemolysin
MKIRLDKLLVDRGLAPSRERAQALILAGRVLVSEQKSDKPGHSIDADAPIRLLGSDLRYVSRGGLKLEAALEHWSIDLTGRFCLDVGASTGGFTDCMLQHGAARVLAVDTGYGQIAHSLRDDPRVTLRERTNARLLAPGDLPPGISFLAVDVSFISATLVLPAVLAALSKTPGAPPLSGAPVAPSFDATGWLSPVFGDRVSLVLKGHAASRANNSETAALKGHGLSRAAMPAKKKGASAPAPKSESLFPRLSLKSATDMYERLRAQELAGLRVGLLHGRLDADDKEVVMRRFQRGEIDVLIATTVIEVGVDVPNATVMVIEHAERFGLAQLHQLRGRVGRGAAKSYCILMTGGRLTPHAEERLAAMVRTQDGFELAELDLELRGPGEFFGTRQAGLPDFRVASLVRDRKLLELAKVEAVRFRDHAKEESTEPERAVVWSRLKGIWQRTYGLAEAG